MRYRAAAECRRAFCIAAKIRWVLITDAEPGVRRIQVLAEYQPARLLEPYLFLKLQRTHHGDALEVMMKAGNAHSEIARNIFADAGRKVLFGIIAPRNK